MQITVQHFNDCPNWLTLSERLEHAIEGTGIDAIVRCNSSTHPKLPRSTSSADHPRSSSTGSTRLPIPTLQSA